VETKYQAALEYYNAKDYTRASNCSTSSPASYEHQQAEDLNYYYSYCYYYQRDYTLASYYFKRSIPISRVCESGRSIVYGAYCNYQNSPEYSLDQSSTYEAIKDLQLFINIFPNSKRVSECNDLIDDLRAKLEYKDYRIARLYFRMGDYNAAITCYNNILKDYPETPHRRRSCS